MRKFASLAVGLPILAVAAAVASAPAYADRDDRHYKNDRNEKYDRREDRRDDRHAAQMRNERAREAQARRFEDRHRAAIHEYYASHYRRHCPPGLERRGNACVSRAQARRWERGRPLPRDVVYYDLPPKLAVEVGPPPRGQRYVRVGADILLIAVGTGLVIDAINDLGR